MKIELRSGTWTVLVQRAVPGGTDPELGGGHLWLRLVERPTSQMWIRGEWPRREELSVDDVDGRFPSERVLEVDGIEWKLIPSPRSIGGMGVSAEFDMQQIPKRVTARDGHGRGGYIDLPLGVHLGEATDEELAGMIQATQARDG